VKQHTFRLSTFVSQNQEMNYLRKPMITCLLAAGCMLESYGQTVSSANDTLRISLAEVWQRAEAHSRAVEIRRKEVAISGQEIKDAQLERLPDLNVAGRIEEATNMPIYDRGLLAPSSQHEVIHTLYNFTADFYLNIYNGNKLNLKIKEDKTLQQIAVIRQDQTLSDVKYRAASLYLELQKSVIFEGLIRQDIADQERQLTEIRSLYKNGVVLKSDVLRIELDLSKRKMTQVQINNDILIANQKLNILIGEPDERPLRPSDISEPSGNNVITYESELADALKHSYAYQISAQQTELSKLHLREVKANVRPKIGLSGDYRFANPQIFLYPYNPYWYSLGIAGISASFPISSIYHNIHKTKAAKIELDKEEEAHKDTEDKVRQQVKEAYLRYQEALIQIDVAKVNVEQAKENARIIRSTYFNQTSLITDLLDADVQVLQTRFELAAARIMAQNKYYLLQNITGDL
jgi:outer membrane protein TolC